MTTPTNPSATPTRPAVVREQDGGPTMRAIVLDGFGGLNALTYTDIPKPLPRRGEVVIRVKGFGINHAEMHIVVPPRSWRVPYAASGVMLDSLIS